MTTLNETHDPARVSWVASANGHADFPIQNLPLGIIATASNQMPRGAVAIGDQVLDLGAALDGGLFEGDAAKAAGLAAGSTLNAFMGAGAGARQALRTRLSAIFAEGSADRAVAEPLLVAASACTLHLPAAIGDYTDFYAGIHHALNVGRQFRPDNPLLPNYKYVPIGYHGRSSSIVASGTPVRRPQASARGRTTPRPPWGRRGGSTTSSSSASGSGPATTWARRLRLARPRSTWPASVC